jgi:hypothetical protein
MTNFCKEPGTYFDEIVELNAGIAVWIDEMDSTEWLPLLCFAVPCARAETPFVVQYFQLF